MKKIELFIRDRIKLAKKFINLFNNRLNGVLMQPIRRQNTFYKYLSTEIYLKVKSRNNKRRIKINKKAILGFLVRIITRLHII